MTNLVFDKKNVYSWSDAEEARQYIGKEGYFSSFCYDDLNLWLKDKLVDVNRDSDVLSVFYGKDSNGAPYSYGLFLPADKVKQAEKKWRPFNLEEFNCFFVVGDSITFHKKGSDYRGVWLFSGYETGSNLSDRELVHLGAHLFGFEELFNDYEWMDKNENWRPFGVEVEE